ncbi:hypothetical protein ACIF8R_17160 [Acinetobacter sp. ABJ_C4_1]|uniref:hypothetical protein n=1 Tax=Acinetobacter sp. ABJ_C4_1 TaxID=3377080 RepID=UPI0037C54CDF
MQKKYFVISSIILTFIISIVSYHFYKSDANQTNIKFRSDIQQDTQVKNNEQMISKSLTNLMNTQVYDESQKEGNLPAKTSNQPGLSNQSGTITLKK